MNAIRLPPGTRIVTRNSSAPGSAWLVVAAPAGVEPQPAALLRKGELCALLTHDDGIGRPNARGQRLAEAILANGGVVTFSFLSLADALQCARWAREGGAR